MSWGLCMYGKPTDAFRAQVAATFDKAAANYAGTEEEKDVLAAKDRALSTVVAFKDTDYANAYKVDCFGSRYSGNASVKVEVTPIRLEP